MIYINYIKQILEAARAFFGMFQKQLPHLPHNPNLARPLIKTYPISENCDLPSQQPNPIYTGLFKLLCCLMFLQLQQAQ